MLCFCTFFLQYSGVKSNSGGKKQRLAKHLKQLSCSSFQYDFLASNISLNLNPQLQFCMCSHKHARIHQVLIMLKVVISKNLILARFDHPSNSKRRCFHLLFSFLRFLVSEIILTKWIYFLRNLNRKYDAGFCWDTRKNNSENDNGIWMKPLIKYI